MPSPDVFDDGSNALPESVTDRPTRAHEYVFLFAKSDRYYFDADAIAEPSRKRPGEVVNRRTVWDIPTVPSVGSHEAVFPPDLPRLAIRAGTRPGDTVLDQRQRHNRCRRCPRGTPVRGHRPQP